MKRWLLVVLAGFLVLGAGLYVLVVRPVMAPSEDAPIAERALAKPDVLLLSDMNVKEAAFLEKWFIGSPVFDPGGSAPAPAVADRTLLDHLRAANIDPRRDIDHVLYALYPSDGTEMRRAIVFLGRFDPGTVGAYLTHQLKGLERTISGRVSYEVTTSDPTTCQPSTTWMISITPRWILAADVASHAEVLARLSGEPRDAGSDLAWWRPLARGDVLSLGVWDVDRLRSAPSHPLLKASANSIAMEADGVRHVYLGLGVKPVPPQGRLRLVVDAQDASRVRQQLEALERAVDESRSRWTDTMPTVAALYRSLRVHTEGPRSTIEFTVDRALATNLQQLVNEIAGAILGGLGVQSSAATATPPAERLDPSPAVFQPSVAASSLGAYDSKAPFAEEVDQAQGPFGLRIGAIRVGADPAVGLEMDVEAFSGAIPNVVGEGDRIRLFVESVKSTSGRELLRTEDCGKERNALPVSSTSWMSGGWKAAKTVRLIPEADARSLRSVSGHVELRLPTRTEAVIAPRPGPGTVIRKHGATFTVTRAQAGSVAYQISGATDRVILFRALNGSGQPLDSRSAYWTNFLFGEGIAGQKDFAGSVDRVEVVFAADTQTLTFPFTLTDVSLAGQPAAVFPDRTPPFRPYDYAAMVRDEHGPGGWKRLPARGEKEPYASVALLEPFELYFDRAQAFYVLKLDFTLRSPDLPNFQQAFSVGQVRLTRIELEDGTVLAPPANADPAAPSSAFRPTWDTPIRFTGPPKEGALATPLSFLIDSKAKPEQLKKLEGMVTLRFPRAFETLRLDDLSVGQRSQDGAMTVTVTGRGRKSLTLRASQDGGRIAYVQLLNADGHAVAFFGPHATVRDDGTSSFELSPLSSYATAVVVLAGDVDTKEYPFVLTAR